VSNPRDPRHLLGHGQPVEPAADESERLAQLVDNLARSQPPRRAPASLEARVFAQIAAQPWWRKGFVHWPLWARGAFLVASVGAVRLALAGVMSVTDFVSNADVTAVDALHRTGEAVSTTVSLGEILLHAIPPVWLYAGAAVGFTLYAVLFGLGTFAYRTLYVQR
jgi:predicted anti-sigma-YlaC factor YlaD